MKKIVNALGPRGWGTYEASIVDGQVKLEADQGEPDGILCPGFVDIHIHGAFGIDFMSATAEEMAALAGLLSEVGYEAFLPTTVTAPISDIQSALSNLPHHPMVKGFHLEGPFISPDYPGAQPPKAIADIPIPGSEWDVILDDPRLRVITLAPEKPRAPALIGRLAGRGVKVSMGHTNATYPEAVKGFQYGARHSTHTFNAMRPFHHREAGMAGFCMAEDGLCCELIYDRIHVSPDAAGLLLKCKGQERVIAVSDSTMGTGKPEGAEFEMWGHPVVKGASDIRLKSNGALAGSCIHLGDAFRNLAVDFGPEVAIRACCLNPRAALGMTDHPAVWLEFDHDFSLRSVHRLPAIEAS